MMAQVIEFKRKKQFRRNPILITEDAGGKKISIASITHIKSGETLYQITRISKSGKLTKLCSLNSNFLREILRVADEEWVED